MRSKGTMGDFLVEVAQFYKEKEKAPLDLNMAPLKFNALERNPLARLITNTLFKSNMQIKK